MMNRPEIDIINGCIKGDRRMQKALYDLFSKKLLVVCLRYSKLQQEAEDILQEAFVKIYASIKDFRQDSSLWFWMKRIVINTALNYHRSKLFLYPMVDVELMKDDFHSDVSLSGFHFKELMEMIQELPDGCQVIFNLYAIEGYKHQEISKMLEISEGTSKSQYARARQLLINKIQETKGVEYGKIK